MTATGTTRAAETAMSTATSTPSTTASAERRSPQTPTRFARRSTKATTGSAATTIRAGARSIPCVLTTAVSQSTATRVKPNTVGSVANVPPAATNSTSSATDSGSALLFSDVLDSVIACMVNRDGARYICARRRAIRSAFAMMVRVCALDGSCGSDAPSTT